LELQTLLRAPELRQLDQRISIRYELEPLDRDGVAAYIAHRLMVAGAATSIAFAPDAIDAVHRFSGGIPRLINLVCDRALLAGFSAHAPRISGEHVAFAAEALDAGPVRHAAKAHRASTYFQPRASLLAAATLALAASATAVGATAWLYERFASSLERPVSAGPFAILIGSYPPGSAEARQVAEWVQASGLTVNRSDVDLGVHGRWQRILAGAYSDRESARRDAERLKAAAAIDGRIVSQPVREP
jgi:hypothetical protein